MEEFPISLDQRFRSALADAWNQIQALIDEKIEKPIIRKNLREIAEKFYELFHDTEISVKREEFLFENYDSVFIPLQHQFCFLFPHLFFVLAKSTMRPPLDAIFRLELPWKLLL